MMSRSVLAATVSVAVLAGARLRADDQAARLQVLTKGVLEYGGQYYDEQARLVRRTDYLTAGRLSVAQHSIEYAAALLDAGLMNDRANAIVNAVLDHQWNKPGSQPWQEGNFIWWGDEDYVRDRNAVVFLTPWLCYVAMECDRGLTPETRQRLWDALPRCIQPIRRHPVGVGGADNQWLLRAASMLMLSQALHRPELLDEAEAIVDTWCEQVGRHGVSEFNSPCYAAVNVFAFEWIHRYAPTEAAELRRKTDAALEFLYTDAFLQWHGQAGIGAGTHSRAYSRDADNGHSLVSFLVYKHCGGELRTEIRCFEYVFVVGDYQPSPYVRSLVMKKGMPPVWMQSTHPVYETARTVHRDLFMLPELTLATQTGRRQHRDQDVLFKITYAGCDSDVRASWIRAMPSQHQWQSTPVLSIAHQLRDAALVLYELDMKGRKDEGMMRLVIEPAPGGMIDELSVNGHPLADPDAELNAGDVIGWRAGQGVVVLRLLRAGGVSRDDRRVRTDIGYALSRVAGVGLCLDGVLVPEATGVVGADDLSCGFVVSVTPATSAETLAEAIRRMRSSALIDEMEGSVRTVAWDAPPGRLHLVFDQHDNKVVSRETDGRPCPPQPLYEATGVRLPRGACPVPATAPAASEE